MGSPRCGEKEGAHKNVFRVQLVIEKHHRIGATIHDLRGSNQLKVLWSLRREFDVVKLAASLVHLWSIVASLLLQ